MQLPAKPLSSWNPLYDTVTLEGRIEHSTVKFFDTPLGAVGKTLHETNSMCANRLPDQNELLLVGLSVVLVGETFVCDVARLRSQGLLHCSVGSCVIAEVPLDYFINGVDLRASHRKWAGLPVCENYLPLPTFRITDADEFSLEISWQPVLVLESNVRIRAYMIGPSYAPVI